MGLLRAAPALLEGGSGETLLQASAEASRSSRARPVASSPFAEDAILSHDIREPKAVQVLSCLSNGNDVRWQGTMARVACPAHCEREPAAVAVGTGVHPISSPICLGAIVDNILPVYGGEMVLSKAAPVKAQRMAGKPAGLESYSGGESDVAVSISATGLKGEAWQAYPTDTIDMSKALPPEHVIQDCMQRFDQLPLQKIGESVVVNCPGRCGGAGKLVGTMIYSPDSSVCWAAEHAKVVGPKGGRALVTRRHGQNEFFGSTEGTEESQDGPGANHAFTLQLPTSDVLARMSAEGAKAAFL